MTSITLQRSRTRKGTAYLDVGHGEPLVLIHGVGLRLEAWTPQIEAFARTHRVVALDMPGHGESAPLVPGSELPDFVAWLGAALTDIGLDRVNIAGHSMGALIAGGAAVELGPRVARVALVNGVFRRDAKASAAVIERARQIAEGVVDIHGPLERWYGDDEDLSEARRLTESWLSAVDPVGYATAYNAFARGDATYADALATVTCPSLFLTSSDDPNSTPAMAEAMAKTVPNGRAVIIPGHRHMVTLTAPKDVNRILAEWLNS